MTGGVPKDTPVTVLIQLASLVVHAKEATGPNSLAHHEELDRLFPERVEPIPDRRKLRV